MCTSTTVYLKGAHTELNTQTQVHVEVVWQEVEDHVVGSKEWDKKQGGLSQAPGGKNDTQIK